MPGFLGMVSNTDFCLYIYIQIHPDTRPQSCPTTDWGQGIVQTVSLPKKHLLQSQPCSALERICTHKHTHVKNPVPDTTSPHLWAHTHNHTQTNAPRWASCGRSAVLNNGYWGEVKPLAAHHLVAKGSGVKTQDALGILHDSSFRRVTPGHHTPARSHLISGNELDL